MNGFISSTQEIAKPLSLILLAVQNFGYGILLPLSRKPNAQGNQYYAPSSVVAMELIKIALAVIGLFTGSYAAASSNQQHQTNHAGQYRLLPSATPQASPTIEQEEEEKLTGKTEEHSVEDEDEDQDEKDEQDESTGQDSFFLSRPRGCLEVLLSHIKVRFVSVSKELFTAQAFRMSIPAILYVVQNNLQILSGGYLKSTEFQVLSQLKLVSTAIFSVWLLGKRLSRQQWASIVLLFLGMAIVQCSSILQRSSTPIEKGASAKERIATIKQVVGQDKTLLYGTLAIVLACICSGLAGVLIEMQLKRKTNFWVTNLHLSTFSLVPGLIPIFTDTILRNKFEPFRHYNALVWTTVCCNAIGGLLVAVVLKFADNICKGFAICAALLFTVFYDSWASGTSISVLQLVGASMVAASTIWYAKSPAPLPPPQQEQDQDRT